jgi:predicted Zn finger-like uncharacterized protein
VNVTCTNCGKKYVISDDKVAGKASVKIRCKQCQSLLTVAVTSGVSVSASPSAGAGAEVARSASSLAATSKPPAPASGPWADEPTRAMPGLDTSATWYAMVHGTQVGPLDVRALSAKVQAGEVTLRTYLWKPGMADWKRASDVPEVSPIFAGVSVGATATGPTQPAPETWRTGTRTPAGQRDVATANEVPSPEMASRGPRTATHSGVRARPSPQPQGPAPEPQPKANPQAHAQPLNELFSDVGGTGEAPAASQESAASDEPTKEPLDPFAQLSQGDGVQAPPIGEATRFFIAQAGVNKRNPPWKMALFAFAFLGVPLGLVYLLQSFHIVELPTVTRTNEDGTVTQEPFFSPGGMSGLKDILTGDAKRKKAEAERLQKEKEALAAAAKAKAPPHGAELAPEPTPQPKPPDPSLKAFYEEDDKRSVGPRVRKSDLEPPSSAVNSAGLAPETVAKVVADKSKSFQLCIDTALHRNPNLSVGNITVVLNVGASGAVRSASIEPKKYEGSDWAQCMVNAARRIVFPASDGETQVELPFKVGVAMSP